VQKEEGKLELDASEPINPRPHITYTKIGDDALYYEGNGGYGFIPFFRLDNNRKQVSGLKPIKDLIDDYDLMACGLSNNLQDIAEGIYVVKGFQGADLDEMIQNVKVKKHIGVAPDGGLDIKTIDIPYEARKVKLELDEKNIYRFGMGFNSAQLGDGNITNIVIKSRYALLDLKCNKLEIRLKQFLRRMVQLVLDEVNEAASTDYQLSDVYFEFEREVMTNASDNAQIELTDAQKIGQMLDNLLKVSNILDDETIVQEICAILDIDYEEIKDKIPKNEEAETEQVQQTLNNVVPDDTGGDAGE
jgi:SPP1 family phage portal protein